MSAVYSLGRGGDFAGGGGDDAHEAGMHESGKYWGGSEIALPAIWSLEDYLGTLVGPNDELHPKIRVLRADDGRDDGQCSTIPQSIPVHSRGDEGDGDGEKVLSTCSFGSVECLLGSNIAVHVLGVPA